MSPKPAATAPRITIGLTGNVACGKSAVATILRQAGCPVVDADEIAREVTAPGEPALAAVAQAFGPTVLAADGALDRAALRARIFGNDAARKRLESILHPAIGARSKTRIDEAHEKAPLVFYDAALLVEAGRAGDFDGLLVVTCPEEKQLERLKARDSLTDADALKIMGSQLAQGKKAAAAHWVIVNDGSLADLARNTLQVLGKIRADKGLTP